MTPDTHHYLIIGYCFLSLLVYTLLYNTPLNVQVPKTFRSSDRKAAIALVFIQRLAGFLLFGLIPVLMVVGIRGLTIQKVGLLFNNPWATIAYTLITILLILPFNYLNAKQIETQKQYPQIRVSHWTMNLFKKNSMLWGLYLWGYEFLFRGFLFFTSLEIMTVFWAIVLNITLYALAHWPKGMREVLGAIPFGLILCVITYLTGNFWYAFFVHTFLALSAEWFSLQAHPQMILEGKEGNQEEAEKDLP